MIESMTGYGAAEHVEDGVSYALEVRSVNHRYLKLTIKLPETLRFAENAVDKLVRRRLARGSVTYALRTRCDEADTMCPISVEVLQHYVDQLAQIRLPSGLHGAIDLGALTALPGVCQPPVADDNTRERQLRIIETLTDGALDALVSMRREEGQALHHALLACCDEIRGELTTVSALAPRVIEEYHGRLKERVAMLLQGGGYELEESGLMREVAIYAERCDVTEELTRMTSHLDQFTQLCDPGDCVGRTLDFLTQELLREANTIASKSNDTGIARSVARVKGLIDRLKEQVQNVQ
ncbi:MAG: YicC/YloC family endoribonuclease [Phycisphaerae bacterium]